MPVLCGFLYLLVSINSNLYNYVNYVTNYHSIQSLYSTVNVEYKKIILVICFIAIFVIISYLLSIDWLTLKLDGEYITISSFFILLLPYLKHKRVSSIFNHIIRHTLTQNTISSSFFNFYILWQSFNNKFCWTQILWYFTYSNKHKWTIFLNIGKKYVSTIK